MTICPHRVVKGTIPELLLQKFPHFWQNQAFPFFYYAPKGSKPIRETWEMEAIADYRVHRGRQQWKVRWKGKHSDDDPWGPASSFIERPGITKDGWEEYIIECMTLMYSF